MSISISQCRRGGFGTGRAELEWESGEVELKRFLALRTLTFFFLSFSIAVDLCSRARLCREKGHWTPQVEVAADQVDLEAEAAQRGNRGGEEKKESRSGRTAASASSSSSSGHNGRLPHLAPPMDPYRRLALYTGPQMAVQAFRSDLVHHQLTGRPLALSERPQQRARTRGKDVVPSVGWSLEAGDVRAGVGQRLRVSRTWVAQQLAMGRRGRAGVGQQHRPQARQSFRWYFLTEDNHWAPLDAKDMAKLDQCYESAHKAQPRVLSGPPRVVGACHVHADAESIRSRCFAFFFFCFLSFFA